MVVGDDGRTALRRILLGDDDPAVLDNIRRALGQEGFAVDCVRTGRGALVRAISGDYELVILDPALPGLNGMDGCRALRARSDVPLLLLSQRDSAADRVLGLEAGADAYLGKPYATAELVSRVNALIRRRDLDRAPMRPVRRVGDIEIDLLAHRVLVAGRLVQLTPSELRLLGILAETPDQPRTPTEILSRLWETEHVGRDASCRTHIHNLRRKLEAADGIRRIRTVRGVGYVLLSGRSGV